MKAPNVPSLDGFRLGRRAAERVAMARRAGKRCERCGCRRDVDGRGAWSANLICITLGTGVGGGIILDGKLWRGVDGSAGELGHIGIEPFGGVACTCGSRGCLEVYASATAIVRMTREARPRYPSSPLHTSEELTAKGVYEQGSQAMSWRWRCFAGWGFIWAWAWPALSISSTRS